METISKTVPSIAWFALSVLTAASWAGESSGLDTAKIEQLTGARGRLDDREHVFRVSVPRTDLGVTVAGVKMVPPLGLTSWAAFKKAGEDVLVMGDMVLTEDQVSPVLAVALEAGLDVTALHNHFLWDSPRVMFLHIEGKGEQERLASAVGKVFAKIRATSGGRGEPPRVAIDPAKTTLNPKRIDAVLGASGELSGGVYKITIGRKTRMHGEEIAGAMGVNTWAAFAGSDQQAVVDGDFAMEETELQEMLRALHRSGIHVVAIHNHMVGESPRIVFLHYWGVGATEELARGLKAAIEARKR